MMYLPLEKLEEEKAPSFPALSDNELIDAETAQKLESVLGTEVFVEVVELFVTEARRNLEEILKAYDQQSLTEIASKSHSIKSSAATVGCMGLAELLTNIEFEAKSGHPDQLDKMITQLQSLMKKSLSALSQHIEFV